MKSETYRTLYIRDQFSYALNYKNYGPNDGRVHEVKDHPPWDKFISFTIAHVGTGNDRIYVLLGSVMCNFVDGQDERWFEIAIGKSRDEVEIWLDMNSTPS